MLLIRYILILHYIQRNDTTFNALITPLHLYFKVLLLVMLIQCQIKVLESVDADAKTNRVSGFSTPSPESSAASTSLLMSPTNIFWQQSKSK
jgi:hypothetical protein